MFDINLDESLCQECIEAQTISGIDVKRLLSSLTEIKQKYHLQSKELSDKEIKYLCLLLSDYSKEEIAYYFYKHHIPNEQELTACEKDIKRWKKNLNSEMVERVNKYIKELMNLTDENQYLPSRKNIIIFLQSSGYKINKRSVSETKQQRLLVEYDINVEQPNEHIIKEVHDFLKKKGVVNTRISQIIDHR